MEDVLFASGIVVIELGLATIITWIIILLRRQGNDPEARRRQLAALEREEENLKKAA